MVDPRTISFPVYQPPPEPCQLSSFGLAVGINVLCVLFVTIFSWKTQRNSNEGVILRLVALFLAAIVSTAILHVAGFITIDQLTPRSEYSLAIFVETMCFPFGITLTLFAGVMIDRFMDGSIWRAPPHYSELEKIRAYVVGPIIEEYLYRFLVIHLLLQCFSAGPTVWISAILFSVSHAHHHYYAFRRDGGSFDWNQFGIHLLSTLIFGLYSSILYIRVKSVVCLAFIHAYCNWMQLPRLHRIFSNFYVLMATFVGLLGSMMTLIFFIDGSSRYRAYYVT